MQAGISRITGFLLGAVAIVVLASIMVNTVRHISVTEKHHENPNLV